MRPQRLLPALLFALCLLLTACGTSHRVPPHFEQTFPKRVGLQTLEIAHQQRWQTPAGETRLLLVGIAPPPQGQRQWRVVWAEYGPRTRHQWIPLAWGPQPEAAPTLEDARRLAERVATRQELERKRAGYLPR